VGHEIIVPEGVHKARGYSHAVRARPGPTLYVAGQVACDLEGGLVGPDDIVKQFDQALANFLTVVWDGGGRPEDVVKLTLFVKDKRSYFARSGDIGKVYRSHFGKHYPAMTLVEVRDLAFDGALVEVEGIAVLGREAEGR
jgi:enamine deaminase RidA (YjgF/YER057c/UK114 family)